MPFISYPIIEPCDKIKPNLYDLTLERKRMRMIVSAIYDVILSSVKIGRKFHVLIARVMFF